MLQVGDTIQYRIKQKGEWIGSGFTSGLRSI